MLKILNPGRVLVNGIYRQVFISVLLGDRGLSISGVIGALASGNCFGSCGQIDMEFNHRDPSQNTDRFGDIISETSIKYDPAWTSEKWLDLLDIWSKWHSKHDIPAEVVKMLEDLPESKKECPWKNL